MSYPSNDGPDLDEPDRYKVTAAELRQFIARVESVEVDMRSLADDRKEIYAEAKARGYDAAVLRAIVARRKKDAEKLAEQEAVQALYLEALGDI